MKPGVFSLSFTNHLTKRLGERNLKIQIHCPQTGFNSIFNFSLEIVKQKNHKKKSSNNLGLPEFIEIGLDTGYDDVTEETAALLDGEVIAINTENKYLLSHLLTLSEESDINYAKAFYTYSIVFGAISSKATYLDIHSTIKDAENIEPSISLEDTVVQDTKAVARTLFVNENLVLSMRKGM